MSNENNKRMSPGLFFDRFWKSIIIIYLTAFVIVGGVSLIGFLSQRDTLNLRRFQHDFFAGLSGQEEKIKYGREDALQISKILRLIPPERRNEDFSDILVLALAGNKAEALRDQLAAKDFSKLERLSLYASSFQYRGKTYNEDWRDTFLDVKMRLAIVSVLDGSPAPVIQRTEGLSFFHRNTWLLIILITQFLAFSIYSLTCIPTNSYDHLNNPLFDLPKGPGPKLSFLITFPGSIPVMLLIMIFSGPGRLKRAFARNQELRKEKAREIHFPSLPKTREALDELRKQLGKGAGQTR